MILRFCLFIVCNILIFLLFSMNAPVMVELEGETDPLEVLTLYILLCNFILCFM